MNVKEATAVINSSDSTYVTLTQAYATFVRCGLKGLANRAWVLIHHAAMQPLPTQG